MAANREPSSCSASAAEPGALRSIEASGEIRRTRTGGAEDRGVFGLFPQHENWGTCCGSDLLEDQPLAAATAVRPAPSDSGAPPHAGAGGAVPRWRRRANRAAPP